MHRHQIRVGRRHGRRDRIRTVATTATVHRRLIARLVLVRRHVTRQMVALAEALLAHRALELLLALAPIGVGRKLALVMGAHVIDQVAGHAEADVALGAHVLRGQRERGGQRWRNERGEQHSGGSVRMLPDGRRGGGCEFGLVMMLL